MSWQETPIHFIDFEGARHCGVVEFGVATLVGGDVARCETAICRPTGSILGAETGVHGISQQTAERGKPFTDYLERFTALRAEGPFAAHHAPVENALIKGAWPFPRYVPDFSRHDRRAHADWGPWIDTRTLAATLVEGVDDFGLESLVECLGLTGALRGLVKRFCPTNRARYHCALHDALASAVIFSWIFKSTGYCAWSLQRIFAIGHPVFNQGDLFE